MPTATGLIIIKDMPYRSEANEEWSNRYWLTGVPPTQDSAWKTLADALIVKETSCYRPAVRVVRAYGYNNSDDHSPTVWVYDYAALGQDVSGTLTGDGVDDTMAGDQAGMISWRTSRRNLRGKWIYLRKFFHGGFMDTTTNDGISGATLAQYSAFALGMSDASLPDGRIIRSATQDETITLPEASAWVTTRTLKRRGKRPALVTPP